MVEDKTKMREELIKEYEETKIGDTLVKEMGSVLIEKNSYKRNQIREEYIKTLDDVEQLAIYLHSISGCKSNAICQFERENDGLIDNWSGKEHSKYLKQAKEIMRKHKELDKAKEFASRNV